MKGMHREFTAIVRIRDADPDPTGPNQQPECGQNALGYHCRSTCPQKCRCHSRSVTGNIDRTHLAAQYHRRQPRRRTAGEIVVPPRSHLSRVCQQAIRIDLGSGECRKPERTMPWVAVHREQGDCLSAKRRANSRLAAAIACDSRSVQSSGMCAPITASFSSDQRAYHDGSDSIASRFRMTAIMSAIRSSTASRPASVASADNSSAPLNTANTSSGIPAAISGMRKAGRAIVQVVASTGHAPERMASSVPSAKHKANASQSDEATFKLRTSSVIYPLRKKSFPHCDGPRDSGRYGHHIRLPANE